MTLTLSFIKKEIEEALCALQYNKAPGEDGFPSEFYKEFKDLLLLLLMDVINSFKNSDSS